MSEHILAVTDNSFEQDVLQSSIPVLVDFWAPWCGPCRAIGPVLEKIAPEYKDKITIAKVNVDENNLTPTKYGVRGIPSLMIFKNGNLEATKVGSLSETQLREFIDTNL